MLLYHQGFRVRRGQPCESVELRSTRQPGTAVPTWLPVVARHERDALAHILGDASLSPADHLME